MPTKTYVPPVKSIEHKWYHVDASGVILGRLASRLAVMLQGKHKAIYTPHLDCGDCVVVTNAEKVRVTGKKDETMRYYSHTGHPAGLRTKSFKEFMEERPQEILRFAVRRMLPKTKLGRKMISKLHIYAGPQHPHAAQGPEPLDLMKRTK